MLHILIKARTYRTSHGRCPQCLWRSVKYQKPETQSGHRMEKKYNSEIMGKMGKQYATAHGLLTEMFTLKENEN